MKGRQHKLNIMKCLVNFRGKKSKIKSLENLGNTFDISFYSTGANILKLSY
jgi:hypothetical protein